MTENLNQHLFIDFKRPFENFDKIQFNSKNEIDKILEWRNENKDLVRNFNFVLEQGLIELTFNGIKLVFEKQEDEVYLAMLMKNDDGKISHFMTFFWRYKVGTVRYIHPDANLLKQHEDMYQENTQSMITIFASLMAFMEHYKEDKKVIQKRSIMSQKVKNRKKKGKKKTVRKIGKTSYLINLDSINDNSKRSYELDKEKAWTVKGHWRTYPNGKKVWVKPYIKGNKENVKNPAIYKL